MNEYYDERSEELLRDNEAQLDELGHDPSQVGPSSAGQSGDTQELSIYEDENEESVEELDEAGQSWEAAEVEGVEDAADHPERPTHVHIDYGRPDDVPPQNPVPREKTDAPQTMPPPPTVKRRDAA